jgi:hypothetical protein
MRRRSASARRTASELEASARTFDQMDYTPQFARPTTSAKRRHDRALAKARRTTQSMLHGIQKIAQPHQSE